MIVCKFGGSCLTDKICLKNIKQIVKNNERKILVFSAIGKTSFLNHKITDELINSISNYEKTKELDLSNLATALRNLCLQIKVKFNINKQIKKIKKCYLKTKNNNYLISRGEYLTCKIFSKYLKVKLISPKKVLFFTKKIKNSLKNNKNKKYLFKKNRKNLNKLIKKYRQIIIPGFYYYENNQIQLFSRGGGDLTGAIISNFSSASVYENYNDVLGIFSVNPSIMKSKKLNHISYYDLKLITENDGTIIHKDCVDWINEKTELHVKSIYKPDLDATVVNDQVSNESYICYSINGNYAKIVVNNSGVLNFKLIETKLLKKQIKKEYKNLG